MGSRHQPSRPTGKTAAVTAGKTLSVTTKAKAMEPLASALRRKMLSASDDGLSSPLDDEAVAAWASTAAADVVAMVSACDG